MVTKAVAQRAGFVDKALGKHRFGTVVDALFKDGLGLIDDQPTVMVGTIGKGVLGLVRAEALTAERKNFEGADNPQLVTNGQAGCRLGVYIGEPLVQGLGAMGFGKALQVSAQLGIASWRWGDATAEGAQVKAGATDYQWDFSACRDCGDLGPRLVDKTCCVKFLVEIDDVDKVVGYLGALAGGRLGAANV